jgi:hypothetical protein
MFRLDGKVAVVTGGGRGIGVMMARGLLQAGATVYLSSRKKAELDAAVAELSTHGPVQAIPADLGTTDGVQALVAASPSGRMRSTRCTTTPARHGVRRDPGGRWRQRHPVGSCRLRNSSWSARTRSKASPT